MYNQYDQLQAHTFTEATKLAVAGEEFSHLIKLLNPDYSMRLKVFVRSLPEAIQGKTIYGRAHGKPATPDKKTKKR
jgi:hypothetical protein